MISISEEQENEIMTKGLYQIVRVCCKNENSLLNHGDAFMRYTGMKKKTIIYNNSGSDIVILIKPLDSCFIKRIKIGNIIDLDIIPDCGRSRQPIKFVMSPKSYQKILVPTKTFSLTICAKYTSQEEDEEQPEEMETSIMIDTTEERDYFAGLFGYFKDIIEDYGNNVKQIVKKGNDRFFSNNKWKVVFTNRHFHTSHDIFVNESELTDMNRFTEVEFDEIGFDNSNIKS